MEFVWCGRKGGSAVRTPRELPGRIAGGPPTAGDLVMLTELRCVLRLQRISMPGAASLDIGCAHNHRPVLPDARLYKRALSAIRLSRRPCEADRRIAAPPGVRRVRPRVIGVVANQASTRALEMKFLRNRGIVDTERFRMSANSRLSSAIPEPAAL